MLTLMQLQQVELVSNESWWSQNSGSIFIAIAAIVAAGLAAYVAIRNHHQQLDHDRNMRNREATRTIIDIAVEEIGEAILRTAKFRAQMSAAERAREQLADLSPDDEQKLEAARAEVQEAEKDLLGAVDPAFNAANAMDINTMRLAIRLGDDHPITSHHRQTRDALDKWHDAITRGLEENRNEAEIDQTQQRLTDFGRARTKFDAACRTWLNA